MAKEGFDKETMSRDFKKNNFIERSIGGVLLFFRNSVFSCEYASSEGFLQSIDPRIKAVTFLLFCAAVLFINDIYRLFYLYLFCLVLARISKINLRFFIMRTWVFIPLFSFFIAIPALFSFVSPGEALLTLKFFGASFIITRPGFLGSLLFVLRVVTSVSFVILLSLTTRHSALLRVLRVFRVPQIFVMVMGMSYRYSYLFMEIVENTFLGIKSRTGGLIHYKRGQTIVAWNIATLWQRSFKLNEEVYNAMLSRGYRGEPVLLDEFKTSFKDWAWGCLAIIVVLILILSHG
jgi:cobalt/nickel transport system permease protein